MSKKNIKSFKYCFIGAGPANVHAVLYIIKQHKINPKDIAIFEKGKSSFSDNVDILSCFYGPNLNVDFKAVRSEQDDLNIIKYLGKDKVLEYYDIIKKEFWHFHPNPSLINITEPTEFDSKTKEGWGSVAIAQSTTYHIGTTNGKLLIQNIEKYFKEVGVNLFFENEVLEVNNQLNILNCQTGTYSYDNLFVATGRAHSKFVNNILKQNNIELKKTYLDIGCRFEIPFTPKTQEIVSKQYDFKFKKELSTKEWARTFCCCSLSAITVEEYKDDVFIGFNGEGKGMNCEPQYINNLTNFGILINLQNINADEIMKLARDNKCQVLGDEFSFKSSIEVEDVQSKEHLKTLPAGKQILEFVEYLKPILGFGENYKIHYPEIKEGSGKIQSNLKWQVPELPNIYFTGDSSMTMKDGGTRGIMPAAVSGMSAVDYCLQK